MPRKREYVATDAKDQTAAARNRALRLRKKGHIEALCPVCSERFGRKVGCPLFDGSTLAAAEKEEAAHARHTAAMRKLLGYDLIAQFVMATGITTKDLRYVTLRAAWRKHAAAIHPDRGGDPAVAAAFNELWERIRKSFRKSLEDRAAARAAKQAPWRVNWNTVEAHRPNVTPDPAQFIDGIPTDPEERKALIRQIVDSREHPCVDPNAGDEFEGEGD
jgi:hypothetical protein